MQQRVDTLRLSDWRDTQTDTASIPSISDPPSFSQPRAHARSHSRQPPPNRRDITSRLGTVPPAYHRSKDPPPREHYEQPREQFSRNDYRHSDRMAYRARDSDLDRMRERDRPRDSYRRDSHDRYDDHRRSNDYRRSELDRNVKRRRPDSNDDYTQDYKRRHYSDELRRQPEYDRRSSYPPPAYTPRPRHRYPSDRDDRMDREDRMERDDRMNRYGSDRYRPPAKHSQYDQPRQQHDSQWDSHRQQHEPYPHQHEPHRPLSPPPPQMVIPPLKLGTDIPEDVFSMTFFFGFADVMDQSWEKTEASLPPLSPPQEPIDLGGRVSRLAIPITKPVAE